MDTKTTEQRYLFAKNLQFSVVFKVRNVVAFLRGAGTPLGVVVDFEERNGPLRPC